MLLASCYLFHLKIYLLTISNIISQKKNFDFLAQWQETHTHSLEMKLIKYHNKYKLKTSFPPQEDLFFN